ncbi:hypothetical protein CSE6_002_00780 [Comamonas sp. E6]|nr:hypothetical protein CSE6_002_00780 [Comamonas sp. E6]
MGGNQQTADSSKAALLSLCKRYADVMGDSAELKMAAAASIANEYEWQITQF